MNVVFDRNLGWLVLFLSGVCDAPLRCHVYGFRHSPVPVRGPISIEPDIPRGFQNPRQGIHLKTVFLSESVDMQPLTGLWRAGHIPELLIWIP